MNKNKDKIYVSEIFGPTIQGEGPNIGKKSVFLRVAGCDFKCTWCDSKYTWDVSRVDCKVYTKKELLNNVLNLCKKTNTSHIILTGGNPCLYDFSDIIINLHQNEITVDIETQGSILPSWLSMCDLVVISPKPPSSGQKDIFLNVKSFILENAERTVIKIPVFNKEDITFLEKYYDAFEKYKIRIYCSVGNNIVDDCDEDIVNESLKAYRKLIDEIFNKTKMKSIHILPQLHVLLWGNKRGK